MPPSISTLLEINEQLHALQGQALAAHKPTWHARFDDVPEGPLLLVANEFFDALPVRQFERPRAAGPSAWSASTTMAICAWRWRPV